MFSSIQSFFSSLSNSFSSSDATSSALRRPSMTSHPSSVALAPSASNAYYAGPDGGMTSTSHLTLPTPIYSPGMRSLSTTRLTQYSSKTTTASTPTEYSTIQLQDFEDGVAPAPPVKLSWNRISRWAEKSYPELFDELNEPAFPADLENLERATECVLPPDVRESFLEHDGQDRSGKPCGLIFGSALLDTDEVIAEWELWRAVANAIEEENRTSAITAAPVDSAQASSSSSNQARKPQKRRNDFTAHQTSVPDQAVHPVYAHTGWLPLAKDFCGNNIAVDLAPGPAGHWGQIILYGREFDRKYVIARSWGHFLAMLADDLEEGRWSVDEDSEELWYVSGGKVHVYFEVLKRRVERTVSQKGQAAANGQLKKSCPAPPLVMNSNESTTTLTSTLKNANASTGSLQHLLTPASPGVVNARLPRIDNNAGARRSAEETTKKQSSSPDDIESASLVRPRSPTKKPLSEEEQGLVDVDVNNAEPSLEIALE
ncbi:uncharacterized protein V1513DRAFT_451038 [Lipomyces chichibuensis]|uniref:uncharacterized protein n=1 Tax=Lipomyces chichibuensis TaxID=1546026 RepID=UPI00334343CE